MRYEIVHDTLARQILDRISGQAKARRQAEVLVARAYERYRDRGVLLTQDDLDEIRPHEDAINFSPQEESFIQKSKVALQAAARRKRQILIGIITVLSVFLVFALWQWQRSIGSTKALQAAAAYEAGYISEAFRLAQSAYRTWGIDAGTKTSVEEVVQKIHDSGLQRDLVHEALVNSFDLDPEEKYIFSTAGKTAYLWDIQGQLSMILAHQEPVLSGGFVPWHSDEYLLTIAGDSSAYFWDRSGNLVQQKKLKGPIKGFAFNKNLQLTLLWAENDLLLLADTTNIWPLKSPEEALLQVEFSPNGKYLLLFGADEIRLWWIEYLRDGLPPQESTVLSGPHRQAHFIASDSNNIKLIAQNDSGQSRIFNESGEPDTFYYQPLNQELALLPPVQQFAFSNPGFEFPKVLFRTDSTSIRYWSAYRELEGDKRAGVLDFYTSYEEPVVVTQFSERNKYLLSGAQDGRMDIWDIRGATVVRFKRFRAQISQARFVHNDQTLITMAADNTIKVWNLESPKVVDMQKIFNNYDQQLTRTPFVNF